MRNRAAALALFALLLGSSTASRAAIDLQLVGGRFTVTADWRIPGGASGKGEAVPLTSETGLFWFFSPGNLELVV